MRMSELFNLYNMYNFYYSEQIYVSESLRLRSANLLELTEDVKERSRLLLDCKIYEASINHYQNIKNQRNKEILEQLNSMLDLSSNVEIEDLSSSDLVKQIEDIKTRYMIPPSN